MPRFLKLLFVAFLTYLYQKTLTEIGVTLKKEEYDLDVKPLLRTILPRFFGGSTGFVDMLAEHIPSPVENAKAKVRHW